MNESLKGYIPTGNSKSNWDTASAEYSEEDTKLTILGHPVMERWEEPYMKELASIAAKNGGRISRFRYGNFSLLYSKFPHT
ncbi:MAG: hypothetical protein QNJ74_07650 [Trichodesmium sp. MO_231.B1]|nr:hypothetical protein [Trichodesmium sp. MO_231.B1]